MPEPAGMNIISRKQDAITLFETVTGYICKSTAEREPFSFDVSGTSGRGSADRLTDGGSGG